MIDIYNKFMKNRIGATCIEYAMIASIVSVVIIASLFIIRAQLAGIYGSVAAAFSS